MLLNFVVTVVGIGVLMVQSGEGILNGQPHFQSRREPLKRKTYLGVNRPLWVLENKVSRPGEIDVATHRPYKSKRRFISPALINQRLPSHYLNLNPTPVRPTTIQSMQRNHKRRQNPQRFPVFDEIESDSNPILIYRGPKAQMIFNTMMTSSKYPMKEPVPGQVMYPPYSPKFKPTPVVKRVRSGKYPNSVFHNVTLIPFYAHEAIDPRQIQINIEAKPQEYSTNQVRDNQIESSTYCENCYHSYYSQDDVKTKYWSLPGSTPSPIETNTPMSLNQQIGVPYSNHRMEVTTSMTPSTKDSFRIMYDNEYENSPQKHHSKYVSEAENPPRKRHKSVHSAKYGGFKTMYPVYTLNKLLKYKPQKDDDTFTRRSRDANEGKRIESSKTPSEETWLIWNSRHKGTPASNYMQAMSSKVRQNDHQTSVAPDTNLLIPHKRELSKQRYTPEMLKDSNK